MEIQKIFKIFVTFSLLYLLIIDKDVNGSPVSLFGLGDFGFPGMNWKKN